MKVILILNTNPELEEDLVDYLLGLPMISGFTSYPVRGHGQQSNLTVAEQVTGRRKRLQVEMVMAEADVEAVLSGLATQVGRDINWWVQPVTASGSFNTPP